MNNHRVFIGWFTGTDVNHLKSGALQVYGKLKKRIPSQVISKILKLSQMQISLQVFFKDFADRFRITL